MTNVNAFEEESVLIINPTGYFGIKLIEKIVCTGAHRVAIFEEDIRDLIKLKNHFEDTGHGKLRFFLGDMRTKDRLARAIDGVDIVLLCDLYSNREIMDYNPTEITQDCIYAYENIVNVAIDNGVSLVLSILHGDYLHYQDFYSLAKQCSEKLLISANGLSSFNRTKFSVLRIGDIFDSPDLELKLLLKKKDINGIEKYIEKNKKAVSLGCDSETLIEYTFKCVNEATGGEIFVPNYSKYSMADYIALKVNSSLTLSSNNSSDNMQLFKQEELKSSYRLGDYLLVAPEEYHWWRQDSFADSFPNEKKEKLDETYTDDASCVSQKELSGLLG